METEEGAEDPGLDTHDSDSPQANSFQSPFFINTQVRTEEEPEERKEIAEPAPPPDTITTST